ncbi:MAG: ABC transporter permease, partial [Planctomycetia bacterium]|nr:ABC transporter permease [Planctomycetia bacterium]
MKRFGWLRLGLAFAATAQSAAVAAAEAPRALGVGPAYETLARLPVLHAGRIKPFDTLAREEVKQIFGRETVKLQDASNRNKVAETWAPVAALYDWSVRPDHWDDQAIILVEYVPLKRLVLADEVRARVAAVAGKSTTTAADRAALEKLAADRDMSAAKVDAFLAGSSLAGSVENPGEDRKSVMTLAALLSEEHKWLSPRQLDDAHVDEAGARLPFDEWFAAVVQKKRKADASATGDVKLTEVEKRAYEVGTRLVHYRAVRDRSMRSVEPLLIMPRPSNKAYLAFLGKTFEKAQKTRDINSLSPIELDGAKALDTYWTEFPMDERLVPGTDPKFDGPFSEWLRDSSAWIPLKAMLSTKPTDLAAAGFPVDKVEAFQKAFKDLDSAEDAAPGRVAEVKTAALVATARSLGESVNPTMFPTVAAIERETHFNEWNPFFKAPAAYLLAVVMLAVSLGFQGFERRTLLARFGQGTYAVGMIGLVSGIGLEAAGFYSRIRISGWAPVTNMYETVIWVSAVAAVLGLVFELIYRKTFVALAGSGVALLGTVLAANVPLLDPHIGTLQ